MTDKCRGMKIEKQTSVSCGVAPSDVGSLIFTSHLWDILDYLGEDDDLGVILRKIKKLREQL